MDDLVAVVQEFDDDVDAPLRLRHKVLSACNASFTVTHRRIFCLILAERLPHEGKLHEAWYAGPNLPEGWVRHPYLRYLLEGT